MPGLASKVEAVGGVMEATSKITRVVDNFVRHGVLRHLPPPGDSLGGISPEKIFSKCLTNGSSSLLKLKLVGGYKTFANICALGLAKYGHFSLVLLLKKTG